MISGQHKFQLNLKFRPLWKRGFLMDCVFINNILKQILRFACFPVTNSKGKNSFHNHLRSSERKISHSILIIDSAVKRFCPMHRVTQLAHQLRKIQLQGLRLGIEPAILDLQTNTLPTELYKYVRGWVIIYFK